MFELLAVCWEAKGEIRETTELAPRKLLQGGDRDLSLATPAVYTLPEGTAAQTWS